MRWQWNVLCILLIVTASASAMAPVGLQVQSLLTENEARTSAHLLALGTDNRRIQAAAGPVGTIKLQATDIRLEVDWNVYPYTAEGVSVLPATSGTTVSDHRNATAASERVGPDSYLFIHALPGGENPGVEIHGRSEIRQARDGLTHRTFVEGHREAWSVSPDDALEAHPDGATVTITGGFVLILWDIDLLLQDDEGTTRVQSGEHFEGALGTDPRQGVGDHRDQQAYLYVSGGALTIHLEDVVAARALLSDGARTEGPMLLRQATGTLTTTEGPRELIGQDLHLRGAADVARGDALLVWPEGQATLEGQSFVLQPTDRASFPVAWVVLGLLLVAAYLIDQVVTYRRLGRAMDSGHYGDALRHARRLRFGPIGRRALHTSRAMALLQTGQAEAAERLLRNGRARAFEPGMREFLLSYAYCLRDDLDTARHWLSLSLKQAPYLAAEAHANPAFDPIFRPEERDVT